MYYFELKVYPAAEVVYEQNAEIDHMSILIKGNMVLEDRAGIVDKIEPVNIFNLGSLESTHLSKYQVSTYNKECSM